MIALLHKFPTHLGLSLLAGLLCVVTTSKNVQAAELVEVELKSGRVFKGQIDSRTDSAQLCLRFDGAVTSLRRTIDWDRVSAAQYDGEQLSVEQLKTLAETIRSNRKVDPEQAVTPTVPSASVEPWIPATEFEPARDLRVRSISVAAYVANWDADVENDGLIIQVRGLDSYGTPVPVQGTVQVELYGSRPRAARDKYRQYHGTPFPVLGQWAQPVDVPTSAPAVLRCQFRAAHPEFDRQLSPFGVVHVRLAMPGHGVFEDSVELVRIRTYSPTRDGLQALENRRFFPKETTVRSR